MRLSAVILAGGQSRRMGRDKASLEYQGSTLLAAALAKIQSLGIAEVFISGRGDQDFSALKCPVLIDREPGLGPISGIEGALREASSPLVLVLPIDLPGMTSHCLRKLMDHCDRLSGALPRLHGRLEPLVAVYPKRCHTYAARNIARGACAVHQFASDCLNERAVRIFRVPDSEGICFTNCNTPKDLEKLAARGGAQLDFPPPLSPRSLRTSAR